jgi:hypothetical protein
MDKVQKPSSSGWFENKIPRKIFESKMGAEKEKNNEYPE